MSLNDNFCQFHRHSEYSPLDGTGTAAQYAEQAATVLQHKWLGLTDHGTLAGALDHVRQCRVSDNDIDSEIRHGEKRHKDEAIIPIVGCEVYWVGCEGKRDQYKYEDSQRSRLVKTFNAGVKPHLCLHASGATGFRNLLRIITASNVDGFHGAPRVDLDLLKNNSQGIVVSTACVSSPLSLMILNNDLEGAAQFLRDLKEAVDGRVWVEIMGHDVDLQKQVNPHLVNLSYSESLPLLATSDAHAPFPDWTDTQSIVFALARRDSLKSMHEKEETARETGDEVYGQEINSAYMMNADEMVALFSKNHPDIEESIVKESISNAGELAKSIKQYVIDKSKKIPKISENDDDAEDTLREWVEEGLIRELERRGDFDTEKYRDQIDFELGSLRNKGVLDYFVMVGDLVRWAHNEGIRVGPGRGSAAGCLVSYLIGITGMDPLPYGLLFERFTNPDRKDYPDIDIDFADRDRVIRYLEEKYGEDRVAHVASYQTFGPKALINKIGGYFNYGDDAVDWKTSQEAKAPIGNLDKDIVKLRKEYDAIDVLANKHPEAWKHMERLNDQVQNRSKHASAIIVCSRPLADVAPIARSRGKRSDGSDDTLVVEWSDRASYPAATDAGLFKIDVLGLEELVKHDYTCDLIQESYGEAPDLYSLPVMWDPYAGEQEVFDNFTAGRTLGVFQFGGEGITQLLKAIKPTSIFDLVAANALYRPGAMEFAFNYAKRKNGKEETDYWHPSVQPFLEETFGITTYQEQVMMICRAMGKFTPGQADDMRKAMSKLYRLPGREAQRFMQRFHDQWAKGCYENEISDDVRDRVWESILEWGQYGFNKAHSACYALLAYVDMWLKTHYTKEFYASLLTYPGTQEAPNIVREADEMNVNIVKPDINKSERGFTLDGDMLRYGLLSIKNIGGKAADDVIRLRPYDSFDGFLQKHRDNVSEDGGAFSISDAVNLIKAGSFDEIGEKLEGYNDPKDYLLAQAYKTSGYIYDVHMTCDCVLRSRKFDPDDPYTDEVWKSGDRKGERKLKGKLPYCKEHECDTWTEVVPRRDTWHVARHLHHNMKRVNSYDPEIKDSPTLNELREYEKEVLGLSIQGAKRVKDICKFAAQAEVEGATNVTSELDLLDLSDRTRVTIGGELARYSRHTLKGGRNEGRDMAFIEIANNGSKIPVKMWPDELDEFGEILENTGVVLIVGRKGTYKDNAEVTAYEVWDLEQEFNEYMKEQ